MTRSLLAWLPVALLLLHPAAPVKAQQSRPPARDAAVRAELAAVLLQSRRYEEAAREYRILLARDPQNFAHRLGLARALAWGKRPREAEQELRVLRAQRPTDRVVDELLRSVRQSFEPQSWEAARWLDERPAHVPYRRALARALVREGNARAALPHYDALLAVDTSVALRREAVDAQMAGGAYDRAAELLRRALARTPADTALRHTLARVLVQGDARAAALSQYDTLIAWHPGAHLLFERAQLHLSQADLDGSEADALASLRSEPTARAYLLLGDVRRWRGDFAEARRVYEYASVMAPHDPAIAASRAQLVREERPIIGFLPEWDLQPGWLVRTQAVTDNAAMSYHTVSARHVGLAPLGLRARVDAELQRMGERVPGLGAGATAVALQAGLAGEASRGPFLLRAGARAGVTAQAAGSIPVLAVTTTAWWGGFGISLEGARGPAYPSLLSVAAMQTTPGGEVLAERSLSAALGGPLEGADIALSAQRSQISDGNRRTSVQTLVSVPLSTTVDVLVSGMALNFSERSDAYWDPIQYLAAGAGLEFGQRNPLGWSATARVLAGPALTVEEVDEGSRRQERRTQALQLSGGGAISLRTEQRELGATLHYGSGRTGEYRRLELSLYTRILR